VLPVDLTSRGTTEVQPDSQFNDVLHSRIQIISGLISHISSIANDSHLTKGIKDGSASFLNPEVLLRATDAESLPQIGSPKAENLDEVKNLEG